MLSSRLWTIEFVALIVVSLAASQSWAQSIDEERQHFLKQLSAEAILSEVPVRDESTGQWIGVTLVPSGQTVAPFATSFGSTSVVDDPSFYDYADESLLDHSFSVRNGVAFSTQWSLRDTWRELVRYTAPTKARDITGFIEAHPDEARLLFQVPDQVDMVRGVRLIGEPSEQYLRYREYSLLYSFLLASEAEGDGQNAAWRTHPKLGRYATIKAAKKATLSDWRQFGFHDEIESAIGTFEAYKQSDGWVTWTLATERYRNSLRPRIFAEPTPRTILSPSPVDWVRMSGWKRSKCVSVTDETYFFEFAQVKILRKWMDEAIFDLPLQQPGSKAFVAKLSNYAVPDLTNYPKGRMAVIPVRLILVRAIRTERSENTNHPLVSFVDQDKIHLIGFVVKTLPKLTTALDVETTNEIESNRNS